MLCSDVLSASEQGCHCKTVQSQLLVSDRPGDGGSGLLLATSSTVH